MDISVAILSWNSLGHLEKCLPKLINSLDGTGFIYEIFIIDNGSVDGSVEYLEELQKELPEKVKPIYLTHNTGTTYSRNLAFKKAKGRYIAVLDSDVEVSEGVFESLTKKLVSIPDVGIIAPKLVYPSGRLQKSTDAFPTISRKIVRFFFLKWIEKLESNRKQENIQEVDYAISAFWLFRREILQEVGFLDEAIFYAPEDVDYCLRIKKHGKKIVYDSTVTAVHHAQEISRGLKLNKATLEHVKGLLYYYKKHKHCFFQPKI